MLGKEGAVTTLVPPPARPGTWPQIALVHSDATAARSHLIVRVVPANTGIILSAILVFKNKVIEVGQISSNGQKYSLPEIEH